MEVEIIMDASESKGGWGKKRENKRRKIGQEKECKEAKKERKRQKTAVLRFDKML